jgi:hypothetical protein
MHNYWDGTCGGGVYWSTAKQYKASIANELFLAATAGLHNRIAGDSTYGGWATSEWNWFKNSGLIKGNLVQDGINVSGCTFSTANYTYNQGVILQGLIEQSRATGDSSLLTTANSIATAATQRFNKNGVLYEGCEPNCTGDGQAFKGIFARYLRALATAARTTQYDSFLTTTANSIIANDTNGSGQQGNSFVDRSPSGPPPPRPAPRPPSWPRRETAPHRPLASCAGRSRPVAWTSPTPPRPAAPRSPCGTATAEPTSPGRPDPRGS